MCRSKYQAILSIILLLIFAGILSPVAFAQRVQSDMNRDAYSDFVLITIDQRHTNALNWDAFLAHVNQTHSLGTFGRAGDNIIMADWLGLGSPQLGVVSVNNNRKIDWRIVNPAGGELVKTLGSSGQIVLSGADYNNDGLADAAVIGFSKNNAIWRVWYDMLSPQARATSRKIQFGKQGDRFFFADPYGKGDWLGLVRKYGARKSIIILRNPINGKELRIIGPGAYAKTALRPLPLRQADGKDLLVFPVRRSASTLLYFQKATPSAPRQAPLRSKGEIVIGDFSPEPGEEVAIQTDTGFLVFNPTTRRSTSVEAPSGIVVDEININQMDGGSEPPADGPPPESLAGVCATYSPVKYPEMLIKSEASNHIGSTDPRSTGYSVMCGTMCPKNLRKADIYYSDGSYACSVGMYGLWEATKKPRLYGAAGGAPQHDANQIAAIAKSKGNGKLYLQISSALSGASSSCKEFNPAGRNGGVDTSYGPVK